MSAQLFVFKSTYLTFKAERTLRAKKLAVKLVTKPRHISSECGLAILVQTSELESAIQALDEAAVHRVGVWPAE